MGGVVSVMALSSLFLLMTKYGLEYPNFYEKLYALLVPSIFMAKHRAKFFQVKLSGLSIIFTLSFSEFFFSGVWIVISSISWNFKYSSNYEVLLSPNLYLAHLV